jgi:hypothetical protein
MSRSRRARFWAPVGGAGCAQARLAGALDRALARSRRRHVRRDEQHVDLARGLRGLQLRRPAHARPARFAPRGRHRARRGAAGRARRQWRPRRRGRRRRAAGRLDAGRRLGAPAHDHRSRTDRFIVTAPGANFGAESAFAVVFARLATAQRLARAPGRVNQLVVRLRPGADVAAVRSRSQRRSRPRCRTPASRPRPGRPSPRTG